jgi:hypothetical protein
MFTGGRRFDKYQMNAGIAGYGKKLSADSGSGINPLLAGITDRSFGIGPEWKYTNLKWRLGSTSGSSNSSECRPRRRETSSS